SVSVYVVLLTGVRIYAPLSRMRSDTLMPVYAVGMNDHEAPFSFGSSRPPFTFHWSVNNKEVAALKSPFYP
ncbi:PREDICTED: nuclear pore membrane glycoprotein 210-like, partial [Priapulus caudatus]|uniref:Nuclear pore membrane glycoprotein 210-like n=1 Tax=Priapulus caudatus TaxID=37621 RepID=A0ABM1F834_PRICU